LRVAPCNSSVPWEPNAGGSASTKSTWPVNATGSNSLSDVARAREAGAAAYVTKDRIAAQLIDAIRELAA